jgi:hypothetical protein
MHHLSIIILLRLKDLEVVITACFDHEVVITACWCVKK